MGSVKRRARLHWRTVENYFNYFTEIEERFQQRRGTLLLLNTLDWALMETWKEAGIPLEAVLRGIDTTFDKWEQRPSKTRKVNGLGFCAQEVLAAAEEMKSAAAGTAAPAAETPKKESGFEGARIAEFLRKNAEELGRARVTANMSAVVGGMVSDLREMADDLSRVARPRLEDTERRLTMMEEKLVAALMTNCSDAELVAIRAEADRELAPYRSKMPAAQIDHLLRQFQQKRLLERAGVPRLSLFYL